MGNFTLKIGWKNLGAVVLRVGLGLVVIWFGKEQINDTATWVSYLPEWTENLKQLSQTNLIYINGWFEIILGGLLVFGFHTKLVAFILTLHLAGIVYTLGYNEIGVRDFGLTVAMFSIFLHGPSHWSIDKL